MKIFEINNQVIEYTIERKKIKNCYISIKNGNVVVRVPNKTSQQQIEELIEKRAEWIIKNVKEQKKSAQSPKEYVNGEIFKVLGKECTLNVLYENIKKPKLKFWLNKLIITLPLGYKDDSKTEIKKLLDKFYAQLAEKEIEKAMRKTTMKVGLAPNNYKIKKLKSTWGNCSTTANISININVVMYSRHAIEYVCLHELCHLRYMNHSKNFWNMVEKYMPDYKMAEEELKK